jgi:hypothetical protein
MPPKPSSAAGRRPAPKVSAALVRGTAGTSAQPSIPRAPALPVNAALAAQLEKQRELRCDYVLVKIITIDGQPKPQFCPLKLHHQVFLQLAFNVLKQRCIDDRSVCDVVALHRFLTRYLIGMATYAARGATAGRGTRGGRGGRGLQSLPAAAPPADVTPLMTADELRAQLRAEYGIDVYSDAARLAAQPEAQRDPNGVLLPHELTEEEFFAQMGRPSQLAQDCCVM